MQTIQKLAEIAVPQYILLLSGNFAVHKMNTFESNERNTAFWRHTKCITSFEYLLNLQKRQFVYSFSPI